MKPIMAAVKHKLAYQFLWIGCYIGIYAFFISLTYWILLATGLMSSSSGSLGCRLWGLAFLQFAVALRFKEDFELFLNIHLTRTRIWAVLASANLIAAFAGTVCIALEKTAIAALNSALGMQSVELLSKTAPYQTGNMGVFFLFFFSALVFLSAAGMLVGSLFYRFGPKSVWFFWLAVSLIPVAAFTWNTAGPAGGSPVAVFSQAWGYLMHFNVPAATASFAGLSIVTGALAFMHIRSLELA